MTKLLIKKQWKFFILIILGFCLLYMTGQIKGPFDDEFNAAWVRYLAGAELSQRDVFFKRLSADYAEASAIVDDIENFNGYEGEITIPEGVIDPAILATGDAAWMNYDMAVWRETMLNMPGQYTGTLRGDERMLFLLSSRLQNQQRFAENLENNQEIMRRGLRRGGEAAVRYQKALSSFQQISEDFTVTDTKVLDEVLSYLEGDPYILVLLALACFSLFSSVVQQKMSHLILSSKMNIRRYVLAQILAALGMTAVSLLVYWMGMLLILSSGDLSALGWKLPIQAVNGYETLPFAISAGTYILINLGLKALCCFFTVLLILGFSLISRSNIISGLLSLAYMGSLLLLSGTGSEILLGGGRDLWTDLPYLSVGSGLISYPALYAIGAAAMAGTVFAMDLALAKPVLKRRVS